MKDVRLYSTENEKIAKELLGTDSNFTSVNMKENSLDSLIKKEKARKFNSEVEKYNEKLEQNNKDFEESQDKIEYDISKAEIKPMFSRILVQPFKVNPFQKMKIENGLIIDTGGYTPHTQLNEQTGRYEEQKQFIVTVPVPFFKQGFISLAENQIIAVVNEGLQDRFNNIK